MPAMPTAVAHVRSIPLWKKGLLGVALLLMVLGGYLMFTRSPAPARSAPAPGSVNGFVQSSPDGSPDVSTGDSPAWQAGLFKLGFSFCLGFAAGYALRLFFGMTMVVLGVIALGLIGLQYAGLLTIDWSGMEGHFNSFAHWFQLQTTSMQHFIAGQLPSGASVLAGIAVGFKR